MREHGSGSVFLAAGRRLPLTSIILCESFCVKDEEDSRVSPQEVWVGSVSNALRKTMSSRPVSDKGSRTRELKFRGGWIQSKIS